VQWALYAAEDLAKFSMTLNSWLQIINTYMQFRFL
jgi:tRNA threonylcarbamoyladenosine modification (KEOPS) complex  Pcc1 subunit